MIASTFWKNTIHGSTGCDQLTFLRLLVVLAEVAGGVEELLRDDRRPQLHVGVFFLSSSPRPDFQCSRRKSAAAHDHGRADVHDRPVARSTMRWPNSWTIGRLPLMSTLSTWSIDS